MATKRSSAYAEAPNSNDPTYNYVGPSISRRGEVLSRLVTFTGLLNLADVLKLAGNFVAGEKIVGLTIVPSGDLDTDNDLTVNIGWRDGTGTEFASASTGLQTAAGLNIAAVDLIDLAGAASDGDELELVVAAGEAEVSGTYTILILSVIG